MRLICTGDILPADRQYTLGLGTGSHFRTIRGSSWCEFANDYLKDYDILFGNLESPLIDTSSLKDYPNVPFAGDLLFSEWLSKVGYDVLSIANNHILEQGIDGFGQTQRILKDKQIEAIGEYDEDTGSNLVIITKRDISVGFAAFNAIHDIKISNTYAKLDKSQIKKAILTLRKKGARIVCLSFHWGNEYIHIPSWKQINLAREAIDEGADVIIGHHPHVVQPIEKYKKGYIIYSLGNFIFDMDWNKSVRTGMCVTFGIGDEGIESCSTSAVEIQKDYSPKINRHSQWLKKVQKDNLELMSSLLQKGKEEYDRYYYKKLKKNHLNARLGMKIQLARQWFKLSTDVQKEILKGFNRIIKNYGKPSN